MHQVIITARKTFTYCVCLVLGHPPAFINVFVDFRAGEQAESSPFILCFYISSLAANLLNCVKQKVDNTVYLLLGAEQVVQSGFVQYFQMFSDWSYFSNSSKCSENELESAYKIL